ncbi:MAG: RecQ family ATP-dependent DNA helicase, partial [Kiloniellales bacterium]|nr:RecQ family ATP-dependent DNA helicase [Kiloniellales bacterium]
MTSLPADSKAHRVLREVFGYGAFRPGQEAVIAAILEGTSVLTVMPTGSGKSLCYQVPALVRDGLTLVVSPLVALMEDQVAALKLDGVAAETINSSRDRAANVAAWRRVAAGEVRLLYISPERLMTERMLAALGRLPVALIAVDEAHCISRWGPSFRPDYEALARLAEVFPGVPLAAFTATADAATRKDIVAKLFNGEGRVLISGFDRPNIRLAVETRRDGTRQLLDFVRARPGESGIVYCLSRKKTEATAELLAQNRLRALPYHAGLDSAQ